MVLYVKDKTRCLAQRPHYKPEELDQACETIISDFLRSLYNEVKFPIDTEDLKKLIERDADDLDCYADLSGYGTDVEGVTEFRLGKKPVVKISAALTEDNRRENRLRTTLTHEYGHVHFHAYLFEMNRGQRQLFSTAQEERVVCKRDTILDASQTDWMEWQAGYVCGAILMPVTQVRAIARDLFTERNDFGPIMEDSATGRELIARVTEAFRVSQDAARVRLLKLNYLGRKHGQQSIFA